MTVTVAATSDRAAAYARLQPVARRAVDGATVPEMADGCIVLDVIQNGRAVGSVALDVEGSEATITAGACWGDCTYHALRMIEAGLRERGVKRLHIHTKRRGLLAALGPGGYRLAAAHLIKEL
jgi:hypothetical protein